VEVKLLLDTNRLSDALAENDEVLTKLELAEAVHVPVIALGEIRSGFHGGSRAAKNEMRLQWFLSQEGVSVLSVDSAVSHRYAEIHRTLRAQGKPIPTNNLWIAAIALENDLALYTRDDHFRAVPGLAYL
jgi:predicted nucleic acid-binding protein